MSPKIKLSHILTGPFPHPSPRLLYTRSIWKNFARTVTLITSSRMIIFLDEPRYLINIYIERSSFDKPLFTTVVNH